MIDRYEILDSAAPRPDAEHILFCDGTGGEHFRADADLELSHWRPNHTAAEYRAGTSTEICYRFLDNPRPGRWTVAVNNHVDVDGILSVYVLVHSEHALENRQAIIEAADIGDFWGWGEAPAQRVFQGITYLMRKGGEPNSIYEEAFRRIPGFIDGSDSEVRLLEESLAPLRRGIELVEQGKITRVQNTARFAHYVVPLSVAGDDERASYVPEFNEAISSKAALSPHVRARWDSQRVNLVSSERSAGWFHDLWFPGYLFVTEPNKIWIEHCEAAENIEAELGTQKALDYLIGEKFLNFLEAAETHADFRAEIPDFVGNIKTIFERWQLAQYLETARETEPFDASLFEPQSSYLLGDEDIEFDADEVEDMRKDDIRQCTRDLLLVARAREWLLED